MARTLRMGQDAAPLYVGLRLFLGYEWVHAGWEKLNNPAWSQTGQARRGFWERAAAVPEQGRPLITYPAHRAVVQHMLDHGWHAWFNQAVIWGELLVGLGLLLGGLTAIAAVFGLLLNFSFLFAGSASSNPTLVILAAVIIFGWRVAGWWGLDRLLLPALGPAGAAAPAGPTGPPWRCGRPGLDRALGVSRPWRATSQSARSRFPEDVVPGDSDRQRHGC